MSEANDWLLSGGIRSASFPRIGSSVTGHIMREPELMDQIDFATKKPKLWPSGDPAKQIRVVLMTDEVDPDDPEDSGERAVYLRGNMLVAVRQAVRQAGAKGFQIGAKLRIKYVADGKPPQAGFNAPKLYEALYRPPDPSSTAASEPSQVTITEVDPDSIPF